MELQQEQESAGEHQEGGEEQLAQDLLHRFQRILHDDPLMFASFLATFLCPFLDSSSQTRV